MGSIIMPDRFPRVQRSIPALTCIRRERKQYNKD
jgi:hypothetical protein